LRQDKISRLDAGAFAFTDRQTEENVFATFSTFYFGEVIFYERFILAMDFRSFTGIKRL